MKSGISDIRTDLPEDGASAVSGEGISCTRIDELLSQRHDSVPSIGAFSGDLLVAHYDM